MRGLSENQIKAAAASALNRAGTSARKSASDEVRSDWNIKQKDLYGYIKITKASSATGTYIFRLKSKPIPLAKFSTASQLVVPAGRRQKRSPSYKLKKAGGRSRVSGSFVAKMKSGHVGIFNRRGKRSLPIIELTSITPTSMFMEGADEAYIKRFEEVFVERMKHELLRKKGK